MKLLTITKSDFNNSNISNPEIHALVMAFAEFNYDDEIKTNVENAWGAHMKKSLIEDMIEWAMENRQEGYFIEDTTGYNHEFFFDEAVRKLNKNYKWLKNIDREVAYA